MRSRSENMPTFYFDRLRTKNRCLHVILMQYITAANFMFYLNLMDFFMASGYCHVLIFFFSVLSPIVLKGKVTAFTTSMFHALVLDLTCLLLSFTFNFKCLLRLISIYHKKFKTDFSRKKKSQVLVNKLLVFSVKKCTNARGKSATTELNKRILHVGRKLGSVVFDCFYCDKSQ